MNIWKTNGEKKKRKRKQKTEKERLPGLELASSNSKFNPSYIRIGGLFLFFLKR